MSKVFKPTDKELWNILPDKVNFIAYNAHRNAYTCFYGNDAPKAHSTKQIGFVQIIPNEMKWNKISFVQGERIKFISIESPGDRMNLLTERPK